MTGVHSSRELYRFEDCDVDRETDAAILVTTDAHPDGVWVPLSQVERIERSSIHRRSSVVVMTAWIAKKKGLI